MTDTKDQAKNFFKEWLEKLQQESWQLELLISGFVLFGLAQSHDYIIHLEQMHEDVYFEGEIYNIVGFSIFLLGYAWQIFFINLLLHVVLRGLWIGTIGLRYVSGDIDYDALDYSDTFITYFKRKIGSFDDYIEKLEKLCSLIFAYTFLLFFALFSFGVFVTVSVLLFSFLDWCGDKTENSIAIFFIKFIGGSFIFMAFLVFVDFITLGGLKRIKGGWFPKLYLWIYRFYSRITLSSIYRPIIYNFIDDRYTKRFFLLSIPYFLIILLGQESLKINNFTFVPEQDTRNTSDYINPRFYDDLRNEHHKKDKFLIAPSRLLEISLESINVHDESLNAFVPFTNQNDARLLKKLYNIYPYKKEGLRHPFMRKVKTDSVMIREYESKRDEELIAFFRDYKDNKASKDSITWDKEQKELEDKWKNKIKEYKVDKRVEIKEALESLFAFKIDSTDYTSKTVFKYGQHPNRGEQGFYVRIFFDSLSVGEHILHFERKYISYGFKPNSDEDQDTFRVVKRNLPFYKYK